MSRAKPLPRLSRQGYVPAAPKTRVRKGMLIPKPREREANPALDLVNLYWLAGKLGPPERRALREICETGEVFVDDGMTYIVARISKATFDAIAAFEVEGEDREVAATGDPLDSLEGDDHGDREPDHEDYDGADYAM